MTTSVDAQGLFRFLKVPPGKYAVTVMMPGFTTVTRENVTVSVGKNTQVDVQLKLSTVQETVTVTSATPLIDTRKVETGQNFSHDELTEIPTSRDIWSLIQQVPGVQLDTVNVAGNQSATVGGPDFITKGSGNVVYQVDGATDHRQHLRQPLRAPERRHEHVLRLLDLPGRRGRDGRLAARAAELGRDDQRRHQARHQRDQGRGALPLRLGQLAVEQRARRRRIDQGLPTNNTRMIREYGADLGGPIIKDKLWIWVAGLLPDDLDEPDGVRLQRRHVLLAGDDEPRALEREAELADLQLQLGRSSTTRAATARSTNRGAAPFRPPETQVNLQIPTNFYKVEDSNVFSSDLFASIFANYQNPDYTYLGNGSLDCANMPFQPACDGNSNKDIQYYANPDGSDLSYHNNYYYYYAKDPQKQANVQVSKFFNTGSLNHEVKFSFNYRTQIADSATGLPGRSEPGPSTTRAPAATSTRCSRAASARSTRRSS